MARKLKLTDRGELRAYDSDNSNSVGLRAPAALAGDLTFSLPGADGVAGALLQTDGAGNLSFALGGAVSGSGTTGKIPKWSSPSGLTDSIIEEAAGKIGIGRTPVSGVLDVLQTADATGVRLEKSGTGGGHAVFIDNDGTGAGLAIQQVGAGMGLFVDQNGNARGIFVDSEATTNEAVRIESQGIGDGLHIEKQGDGIALDISGPLSGTANVVRLIADTSAISFSIVQNGNGQACRIDNFGTGIGLEIFQSGAGVGLSINQDGNASGLVVDVSSATLSAAGISLTNAGDGIGLDIAHSGDNHALRVNKSSNNAFDAARIINAGTGDTLDLASNGDSRGLFISQSAASTKVALKIENVGSGEDVEGTAGNWVIERGGDCVFGGGYRVKLDGWGDLSVTGNQNNEQMSRYAQAGNHRWSLMTRSGSITGLSARYNSALTAGTITVKVFKNGVDTGASVSFSNPDQGASTTFAKDTYTFVSGDFLDLRVATTATLSPGSEHLRADLEIEC